MSRKGTLRSGCAPEASSAAVRNGRLTTDFAIASGIFNVRADAGDEVWLGHIRETLDVLAKKS